MPLGLPSPLRGLLSESGGRVLEGIVRAQVASGVELRVRVEALGDKA